MPKGRGEQGLDQTEDGVLGPQKTGPTAMRVTNTVTNTGDKRGYKEVEHLGDNLVQTLLEEGENGASDNDGDDVALITDPLKAVHAGE